MISGSDTDNALIRRVAQTVRQNHLFMPGDTLIVGFSGGADSSALLDILWRLPDYNLTLVAAHINHSLRGAESDADEGFCRISAAKYGIPFESRRVDVKSMARDEGMNLEDAGRAVRIAFLDELRQKYAATAVVLAHHADDQAETVLMRLLRGTGMSGLSGMAYHNDRGYVRPLLDIKRTEIEGYLRERGISWCEDASNGDVKYLRNRIRHELLPLLEDYNPAIRSSLVSTASIISGDEDLLEELTSQAFAGSCRVGEGKVECDVDRLQRLKPALRYRVLRQAYKKLVGNLHGVTHCHVEAVCKMLDSKRPNMRVSLPQQITATRAYDQITMTRTSEILPDAAFEIQITEPGLYQLPDGGSLLVELSSSAVVLNDSGGVLIDPDKLPFPWQVRTFRHGDRIQPLGMNGHKKVKDIFIDRKIPASERKRIPLLFCGDDLIWIAGICCSELSRLDINSHTLVRIKQII